MQRSKIAVLANSTVALRPRVFNPLMVLTFSLTGAFLYGVWATWRFSGDTLSSQYLYVVPIVVPFVAFLFDRAERVGQATGVLLVIDAVVVGTAMLRGLGKVPFISGHMLFLTYALLSSRSRLAQVTAGVVILEVIYLKLFIWHDLITSSTGIVLGAAFAFLTWRYGTNVSKQRAPKPA